MFTPINSPAPKTPSPPKRGRKKYVESPSKRAREEQSPATPKRTRALRWPQSPYRQVDEEASVLGDALVESPDDAIPQFADLQVVEDGADTGPSGLPELALAALQVTEDDAVAGPSRSIERESLLGSESSGLSDAPDLDDDPVDTQVLMEFDESLSKGKERAVSPPPSNSRPDSVLFVDDDKSRSNAIEYLSRRCLGKVKGLEKGSAEVKPVPIVRKPVFDARSPMFAAACCLRCSKMAGTEGLYCVRPSKHAKCYRCANNGVPCEPIPASYKAEFAKVQALFQAGTLAKAFVARDHYVKGVTALAHSKPKAKPRAGSVSAGLSDEYKAYWDRKFAMMYRNQERILNYMCKQNGDPPVRPIEELFDDIDDDPYAGYIEQSDD